MLVLLGLAGLLRPEAWLFSGIYWLMLVVSSERSRPEEAPDARAPGELGADPACTHGGLVRAGDGPAR